MKRLFALLMATTLLSGAAVLTGCEEQEGPAEKAGKAVDEAVGDTERAVEDATD